MTKLVIYIPTYNRLESLKTCVSSIASQIQDGIKVYISNNSSTDGTTEYLKSINYPWLIVHHQPENFGGAYNQASAWFIPVETEYIWVIGDDDYLLDNALQNLMRVINEQKVDFIFCNTQAYPIQDEQKVIKLWKDGKLPEGTIKGKYSHSFARQFHHLVDPRVADSLLLEIMCLCVKKSAIRPVDLEDLRGKPKDDFKSAGKFYTAVTGPLLESFTNKTSAYYLHTPLTFNFWGGGNGWSNEYDYIFSVAILYMIETYHAKGIIDRKKYLWLLDYYFKLMSASLSRQMLRISTAKPFSNNILEQIQTSFDTLKLNENHSY